MSDKIESYSWQVETKSGVSTRVDGVTFVSVGQDPTRNQDYFELTGLDTRPLFVAPLSSLSFAKRLVPQGQMSYNPKARGGSQCGCQS